MISISVTNDLGFTIDQMTVYLTSENRTTPYGSDQIPAGANFSDNETRTFEIGFSDGICCKS
ncbi:MAG: hypothetical protein U5K69_23950 [Balneolaceae bacterium]|nr:hypothetical protein [Balneolaceae bacterium]